MDLFVGEVPRRTVSDVELCGHQLAQDVVARLSTASVDVRLPVVVRCSLDLGRVRAHDLARIDVQHGVGPLAQLLFVLLRRAEQRGDDHDGQPRAEVGDVVERTVAGLDELVEETTGERADARLEGRHVPRVNARLTSLR